MARKKTKPRAKTAAPKRRTTKPRVKAAVSSVVEEVNLDMSEVVELPAATEEIAVEAAPTGAGTSDPLVLPEYLDFSTANEVKEALLARRGSPLAVDAGQVRRTGMQAVQILIAAAKTWQGDGHSYAITNPTEEFLDTIALVGLSREHLLIEGLQA
ncbi:STAS domain-containing protein [Hyphomicrobium sp.]|uniref:STAS domain-containing protein n=1 Tax=Hyphomicrobium sp. TaxID=82 RepID=UPI000FAD3F65|nr:STAS domain-containing protein [Hyphomicrobium sp.]RUO98737.1 MAG: STAS domain-containing protein [Hyphomicrobium sp.]